MEHSWRPVRKFHEFLKAEGPKDVPGNKCGAFFPQNTLSTDKRVYMDRDIFQQKKWGVVGQV